MDKILQKCSEETGCEIEMVEDIMNVFLKEIVSELAQGHAVDLGEDFGIFTSRLRAGNVHENSPRTPKESRYKVIFRENKGMLRRLKAGNLKENEKREDHTAEIS